MKGRKKHLIRTPSLITNEKGGLLGNVPQKLKNTI